MAAFTWTLPDLEESRPMATHLERGASVPGETLVVLSGPREDVTARIQDSAGGVVGFKVTNSDRATMDPKPVKVEYTSTGESTGEVAFTHSDAATGQLLTSSIQDTMLEEAEHLLALHRSHGRDTWGESTLRAYDGFFRDEFLVALPGWQGDLVEGATGSMGTLAIRWPYADLNCPG